MSRFPEMIINLVFGIIEVLLGLRFIFRLFGANPASPFVRWLYETSQPLLRPFDNIFPVPVIDGGFVIEFSTLVAIIIYMLIGYLLLEIIKAIKGVPRREE